MTVTARCRPTLVGGDGGWVGSHRPTRRRGSGCRGSRTARADGFLRPDASTGARSLRHATRPDPTASRPACPRGAHLPFGGPARRDGDGDAGMVEVGAVVAGDEHEIVVGNGACCCQVDGVVTHVGDDVPGDLDTGRRRPSGSLPVHEREPPRDRVSGVSRHGAAGAAGRGSDRPSPQRQRHF